MPTYGEFLAEPGLVDGPLSQPRREHLPNTRAAFTIEDLLTGSILAEAARVSEEIQARTISPRETTPDLEPR